MTGAKLEINNNNNVDNSNNLSLLKAYYVQLWVLFYVHYNTLMF